MYLGRPWRDFARVVFLHCDMGAHIRPEGWSNWAGTGRDKTAFYAEFGNSGPGAVRSGRAPRSRMLSKKAAKQYALENILKPERPVEPGIGYWAKVRH